jgi:secreted PhoX family phosphatase
MTNPDRRNFLSGTAASAATMVGAVAMSANPLSAEAATSTPNPNDKKMQASNHATFKVNNTALVLVDHQVGTIG